jgi:hypothetical protein
MDRTQLVGYIEQSMGSIATEAEAACMIDALDAAGYITRDGSGGFCVDIDEISDSEWVAMVAQAVKAVA